MPSLQELTGLPEKVLQEKLKLEPRHRFDPGEPDNLVFMSPSVALQDDELRHGGPNDWGAREMLGGVTKRALEKDGSCLFQVPEITSTHMGYGKRSANKEGRRAITEEEAEDWLRVLKSTKLTLDPQEEGIDISDEEVIELPNPQADPEVFQQGPNLINEEDSGLKFPRKLSEIERHIRQHQPNRSELLKDKKVEVTAEEVITNACANISSESYREVEVELLQTYRDLFSSDIIAKKYTVLAAPDGSPIILIPLKYQVTKIPAHFEDLGKRKTWKKLGKRDIFRQFMNMFIKNSEIQRDFFRSMKAVGNRQGTDFGFILPNRKTYSAFIKSLQNESQDNLRQLEESPEGGLLKPHCAVLKDSGKNITLAFSYLPDNVPSQSTAAVFRALGANYCDHFTIVILHGALLNTEDPDIIIGKLYPVIAAEKLIEENGQLKRASKVKKDYVPIRFENGRGKFTEVDFPVTYMRWEEEVRQIPEISRLNLEPEYVFDEQVNCVFFPKCVALKYKNNPLPGVVSAITPRQIKEFKWRVANLNGCTIKFVARSARKNNVAVLLAIDDCVGPVRGNVASRPRIMQLIIHRFLMAVVVAGLPQVYPSTTVSEDQGGANLSSSKDDDSDDDGGGDNHNTDKSQSINTGCSSRQPFVEADPVTDILLFDLSKKILNDWEEVALRLEFDQFEIGEIKDEMANSSEKGKAKDMLRKWKRDNGKRKGASKMVLATALRHANLSELADFVLEYPDR